MLKIFWSLFLTGLFLGFGPCLLSCGPLLISYIAATKENAGGGLKTYIIFSITRIFVYLLLGVLAGILGEWVLHRLYESQALKILFIIFGFFLIVVGFFLMIERFSLGQKCHLFIQQHLLGKDTKNIILFGLLVSLAPCMPLVAVLGYIALISDYWTKGAFYMGAFALGTAISPMIFLSLAAGGLAKFLGKYPLISRLLKVFCGLIISYLGFQLILSVFLTARGGR